MTNTLLILSIFLHVVQVAALAFVIRKLLVIWREVRTPVIKRMTPDLRERLKTIPRPGSGAPEARPDSRDADRQRDSGRDGGRPHNQGGGRDGVRPQNQGGRDANPNVESSNRGADGGNRDAGRNRDRDRDRDGRRRRRGGRGGREDGAPAGSDRDSSDEAPVRSTSVPRAEAPRSEIRRPEVRIEGSSTPVERPSAAIEVAATPTFGNRRRPLGNTVSSSPSPAAPAPSVALATLTAAPEAPVRHGRRVLPKPRPRFEDEKGGSEPSATPETPST